MPDDPSAMSDPFAVRTTEQQIVVFVAILAYFALFALEIVTGNPAYASYSDLVIAVLAIPASIVIARRATADEETDTIPLIAAVSFLIAGLGVGYGGLAALTDLPTSDIVGLVGSITLVVAVVLYLYYSWSGNRNASSSSKIE